MSKILCFSGGRLDFEPLTHYTVTQDSSVEDTDRLLYALRTVMRHSETMFSDTRDMTTAAEASVVAWLTAFVSAVSGAGFCLFHPALLSNLAAAIPVAVGAAALPAATATTVLTTVGAAAVTGAVTSGVKTVQKTFEWWKCEERKLPSSGGTLETID